MTTSDTQKIERWIDKDLHRFYNTDADELIPLLAIIGAIAGCAWAFISTVIYSFAIMMPLGFWEISDTDQAPPFMAELCFGGMLLIPVIAAGIYLNTWELTRRARTLPHSLTAEQVNAAKVYAGMNDTDKARALRTLVNFLSIGQDNTTAGAGAYRATRDLWTSVVLKIREKNELERSLAYEAIDTSQSTAEIESLDFEIKQIRDQISTREIV